MAAEAETMGLDANVQPPESIGLDDNVQSPETAAKDADGVPYCCKHHCRMKQVSGGKRGNPTAYYGCPVKGCDERQQMVKTRLPQVVPPQPTSCPRCSSQEQQVVCERDDRVSTSAMVILKCPGCGWRSGAMPVPHFASSMLDHRERQEHPIDKVGDR